MTEVKEKIMLAVPFWNEVEEIPAPGYAPAQPSDDDQTYKSDEDEEGDEHTEFLFPKEPEPTDE